MARFLAATWSIPGHYFPNLSVAVALRARGHEVAFFTGRRARQAVEQEGFRWFPFAETTDAHVERFFFSASRSKPWWQPGILHQRSWYYEWLVGELRQQVTALDAAIAEWRPDVLVCDPALWGVFLTAPERHGIPTAIFTFLPFCPLPGPGVPPLGLGLSPGRTPLTHARNAVASVLYRVGASKFRRAATALRREFGLQPLSGSVTEAAGRRPLYLVAGTREFDYARHDLPPSVHYVGPCPWVRRREPGQTRPAWYDALRADRPCVHVTEGTVHIGRPFVSQAAVKGLAGTPVQVVIAGASESAHGLGALPPNMIMDHWTNIHYDDLLPRLDALVSTAGGGTVTAALQAGVPLVLIPTQWDKPEIAQRVAAAGAGVVIPPRRCTPARLRDAVERVLGESSFRQHARRLAESFRRSEGPSRAAALLEGLLGSASDGVTQPHMERT